MNEMDLENRIGVINNFLESEMERLDELFRNTMQGSWK